MNVRREIIIDIEAGAATFLRTPSNKMTRASSRICSEGCIGFAMLFAVRERQNRESKSPFRQFDGRRIDTSTSIDGLNHYRRPDSEKSSDSDPMDA